MRAHPHPNPLPSGRGSRASSPDTSGLASHLRATRPARAALVAGLTLALSGCAVVDADQARLCRSALPAVEDEGGRIEVIRTAGGPEARSLRIDYRTLRDGRTVTRYAICRFADGTGRVELSGITTDRGPVSGARLYMLNRYYLDTPEGVAGDPGPGDPTAGLPEWSTGLAYAVQQGLGGLPGAAITALLAAAYALVFGLVGRINLGFGEIAAVGGVAIGISVAAFTPSTGLTLPAIVAALLVAMMAAALHAAVAGYATFAAVPASRTQASLVATVGMSLALMEYLRLAGGPAPAWVSPMGGAMPIARAGSFIVTATSVSLVTSATGALAAVGLVLAMRCSRFGRAWRACADDAVAAALFGIDRRALLAATLCLGGGLAGLAGGLTAVQFGALGFAGGFQLGLKALAASVLGGIGSVGGALLGGLVIGAFETIWSATMPIEGRDMALCAILIGAIVLRPRGLFGSALEPTRTR